MHSKIQQVQVVRIKSCRNSPHLWTHAPPPVRAVTQRQDPFQPGSAYRGSIVAGHDFRSSGSVKFRSVFDAASAFHRQEQDHRNHAPYSERNLGLSVPQF